MELSWGVFTCVLWQVTLYDRIWQVTTVAVRWGSINSSTGPLTFKLLNAIESPKCYFNRKLMSMGTTVTAHF